MAKKSSRGPSGPTQAMLSESVAASLETDWPRSFEAWLKKWYPKPLDLSESELQDALDIWVSQKSKAENPPKDQRATKPRRISRDTATSLERLSTQVEAATKHLQKMPAANEASVFVNMGSSVGDDYDEAHGIENRLRLLSGEIVFQRVIDHGDDQLEVITIQRLADLPTQGRLEMASKIPDLIRAAKEAESGIRTRSEEIAVQIQKAIEESLEVYE